ncbi:glycosyltransferase family 2 protein [Hespellia stercorisuis]|uniref:Glycosyltransferase, GT2 family n=1 Tax=Hespellia stercorisuis DSM 15480 TaxID=1121950 RepID=A0A1M6Q5W6_9FIRM|nr:glycosyltransferase family 2 protein [Hespellia stercorisuis]SHK15575.1 Glycosyltransferase, GT2 family [Hespellia stercorisuis DSM 15480]
MQNRFEIMKYRYRIGEPDVLLIQGWFQENTVNDSILEVYLDQRRLTAVLESQSGVDIQKRKHSRERKIDTEYWLRITLPAEYKAGSKLYVYQKDNEQNVKIAAIPIGRIEKLHSDFDDYVDLITCHEDTVLIQGWIASREAVQLQVLDEQKNQLKSETVYKVRKDVLQDFPELKSADITGFEIRIPECRNKKVYLAAKIGEKKYSRICRIDRTKAERIVGKVQKAVQKGGLSISQNGLGTTCARMKKRLLENRTSEYEIWLQKHLPTAEELEEQRRTQFAYQPKISIVIPLYKTPIKYLDALIHSVIDQTYPDWELCLSDGSGEHSPLQGHLAKWQKKDSRIRVVYSGKPMQISENTNCALEIATGDYVAFADHDDLLEPNALFENVSVINRHEDADVIYSDEDKTTMNGREHFDAHFKPDYNVDLLNTVNYFCHFLVVKREIADRVGPLDSRYDGAQDYDFVLRCTEATKNIYHIPKIIYHWRAHKDSTAGDPASKLYAFEAGAKAIQAHYDRVGVDAAVYQTDIFGNYRSEYHLKNTPLISIIIPNKDHVEELKKCIDSIEEKSKYLNREYVIVENNSENPETFAYYESLKREKENVTVLTWDGTFNYSAINNYGAGQAAGDYYLFLNNDTEMISENGLEELLGRCMREDVGVVGARLYYEDRTIQHAGVVIGLGGVAGHVFVDFRDDTPGYFSRIVCAQEYSAVTAACMMVSKEVFEQVQGFDEKLAVAYNDIDFCLRVGAAGKRVVYNPFAEFYHYESKSRGADDTVENKARFEQEESYFLDRWKNLIEQGDPYYNPNLTLIYGDYGLRLAED